LFVRYSLKEKESAAVVVTRWFLGHTLLAGFCSEDEHFNKGRSAKKVKVDYQLTATVWKPLGVEADRLMSKLVKEMVTRSGTGFSSLITPYVCPTTSSAIVEVNGGLGEAASGWGLNLDGVTWPTEKVASIR
jgi:hypothetical protein